MSRSKPLSSPPPGAAGVLPLHGGRVHAPSSVLVRARLGEEVEGARLRAAIAFFAEVCDGARGAPGAPARWWTEPVGVEVEEVADRALLPLAEAEGALESLEGARLLLPAERGHRIEADVLCDCPALAGFDLEGARARLRERGELVGPATALLRELLRLADASGVVGTTLPRLQEAVLYGRTRLTQALGVLEGVGLVARRDLPNRMVRVELRSGGGPAAPAASPAPSPPPAGAGARMRLPTGAPLQVGGEALTLAPGIVPELERGADGRYYLWLGPVRIGPYEG